MGTLNSFVATGRMWPTFPGTVGGQLVDVLVELVFPSESGFTYLSNPWLIATHGAAFSIGKEFILTSMQYLPCCKVTRTSSAGPMTMLSITVPVGLLPFASLVLVCSLQTVVIPKFSLITWTAS